MLIPTVHLNGTSGRDLLEQQQAVLDALRAVREAMVAAMPNGRDYYPQGENAIGEAREAFRKQYHIIGNMILAFDAVMMGIDDQINS